LNWVFAYQEVSQISLEEAAAVTVRMQAEPAGVAVK